MLLEQQVLRLLLVLPWQVLLLVLPISSLLLVLLQLQLQLEALL